MAQKHIAKDFGSDRISNLPCVVIDHIFRYLPMRDTVRTSVLSKEWRYKWLTCSHLIFDDDFENSLSEGWERGSSIIYRTLLIHKGHILKFLVKGDSFESYDLDCWLQFLSNRNVEDLSLRSVYSNVIPHHLFSFNHLTHLHLFRANRIRIPPAFKGFTRLVKLELQETFLRLGELNMFLSKCLMMEFLSISSVIESAVGILVIDAPNLKYFKFRGSSCRFCLRSTVLETMAITYERMSITYYWDGYLFIKAVSKSTGFEGNLINVKCLKFNCHVLKCLVVRRVLKKPDNLKHLMLLGLHDIQFSKKIVTVILYLIRNSPNLERVDITCEYKSNIDEECDAVKYLMEQQECQAPLASLRSVCIQSFRGSEAELEFAKLLLLWAAGLRKLEIDWCGSGQNKILVLQKIARFRRASSEAELVFE